jgi:3-methyladenine DNA glycosylase Mpg
VRRLEVGDQPLDDLVKRSSKASLDRLSACTCAPEARRCAGRSASSSGGAGSEVAAAAKAGIDTFITGEGPHWSYTLAEELGVNVLYGGHYATETFGVKALAAHIEGEVRHPVGVCGSSNGVVSMRGGFLSTDFLRARRARRCRTRLMVGVELVWHGCSGIIVETEAYAVEGDPACHTASRPSAREFVKSRPPGAAYVYFNYGMYWLFNLLVKGGDRDGLILIRALEPRKGVSNTCKAAAVARKFLELCSGPGKLAQALAIDGTSPRAADGRDGAGRPAVG